MARSRFSSCFVLSARGAQLGPLFAAPSSRPVVSLSFLRLSLWLPPTALFACSPLRLAATYLSPLRVSISISSYVDTISALPLSG